MDKFKIHIIRLPGLFSPILSCGRLFFIAAIIACAGLLFLPTFVPAATQSVDCREIIIIDPGHGGIDGGAVGINGLLEKDVNLELSLILRDIFTLNGYNVIMTRETDTSTNDEKYTDITDIKRSDLHNRLKLIEEYENSPAILIHQNKFEQQSSRGAQMFYGQKNPESILLAQALQDSIVKNLQPQNQRKIKKSESSVYILHQSTSPIVLAECGFLSNPEEAELLKDSEYLKKLAFAIFCGFEEYQKQGN